MGAAIDLADIDAADILVYFAQERHSAGRSFELGYAHARGKTCIVVGEEKCVFFALPGVVRVPFAHVPAILAALGLVRGSAIEKEDTE